MKISYNWLKEFIDLTLSPAETADKLTLIGLEEEETFQVGSNLEGVVIGEVLEVTQHPNADRLKVCQVNIGEEKVQIVCGADNVAKGQKVPVATVGTTLPIKLDDGSFLTLRKAKLRGETSQGMICAEDELGLGKDHSGIMVLDSSSKVGTPINQLFDLYTDSIIDIAITPNRPDATCHLGVARDLSAALNLELKKPEVELGIHSGTSSSEIDIQILSPEKCNRYVGIVISGTKVAESPTWLKQRLTAIGLRPVNNIVDITNYVMHEVGQPLHAFDYDNIAGKKIIVREFEKTVEFETLDHVKRKCEPGTLFICDGDGPVAIAGVMGGVDSEVSDSTTSILLESAYFDLVSVRKTAKAQTLQTDASYRFERGIDPNLQALAAKRAADLIVEIAGGQISGNIVDVHPIKTDPKELTLRKSYLNRLLGTNLNIEEAIEMVKRLELEVLEKSDEKVTFRIPTFRPDLEREVDLIEEVGRLFDYNNIESPSHGIFVSTEEFSTWEILNSDIRKASVELGFREIYTNSLISEKEAEQFGSLESMVGTINPLTKDMTTLRPSLLHGFLKAASYNFNRQKDSVRFFEIGNVFEVNDQGIFHEGIQEQTHVLFGVSGLKVGEHWTSGPINFTPFDLKSLVNAFLSKIGVISKVKTDEVDGSLIYKVKGERIGELRPVDKSLKKTYDLKEPTFVAEFSVNALHKINASLAQKKYQIIPKFPPIEYDFSLIVDNSVKSGDLLYTIREKGGNNLQAIDIFDVFEDESIGNGKKSIAFRLSFVDPNKTLNIKDVEPIIQGAIKNLEKQFSAKLRG
ncbi:MAG: phenylalanine--tRNA ligase subunit beta [Balneola sp.]|nr:MAG: phenylalanine--tRNA ligase subunit beta [Balneola sp.]